MGVNGRGESGVVVSVLLRGTQLQVFGLDWERGIIGLCGVY